MNERENDKSQAAISLLQWQKTFTPNISIEECISFLSPVCQQICTHAHLQRLKGITQLGLVNRARSVQAKSVQGIKNKRQKINRLYHSVSVALLARTTGLYLKQTCQSITDKEIKCLEIAGLLHDLGHMIYSHFYSTLCKRLNMSLVNHETIGVYLVKSFLQQEYDVSNDEMQLILYYLQPDIYFQGITKKGLGDIVANKRHFLDVDRITYLVHDSLYLMPEEDELTKSIVNVATSIITNSYLSYNENYWMFNSTDLNNVEKLQSRRSFLFKNYYCTKETVEEEEKILKALETAKKDKKKEEEITRLLEFKYEKINDLMNLTEEAFDEFVRNISN